MASVSLTERAEAEQVRLREQVMRAQEELLAELSTPLIPLTRETNP